MKILENTPFAFVRDNLRGNLLEIGSLHNPHPINDKTNVTYCDKFSYDELIEQYKNNKDVDCSKIVHPIKVKDMTDLTTEEGYKFQDNVFDGVINSHIFEHSFNPLQALKEWLRVTKNTGYVFMIVPDMRFTFDSKRDLTTPQHIIDDYNNKVESSELVHYQDYFNYVPFPDGTLHPECAEGHFKEQLNFHVHTFVEESLRELLGLMQKELGYNVIDIQKNPDMHIGCLLQKVGN